MGNFIVYLYFCLELRIIIFILYFVIVFVVLKKIMWVYESNLILIFVYDLILLFYLKDNVGFLEGYLILF